MLKTTGSQPVLLMTFIRCREASAFFKYPTTRETVALTSFATVGSQAQASLP